MGGWDQLKMAVKLSVTGLGWTQTVMNCNTFCFPWLSKWVNGAVITGNRAARGDDFKVETKLWDC